MLCFLQFLFFMSEQLEVRSELITYFITYNEYEVLHFTPCSWGGQIWSYILICQCSNHYYKNFRSLLLSLRILLFFLYFPRQSSPTGSLPVERDDFCTLYNFCGKRERAFRPSTRYSSRSLVPCPTVLVPCSFACGFWTRNSFLWGPSFTVSFRKSRYKYQVARLRVKFRLYF